MTKIRNVKNAADALFPNIFAARFSIDDFTPFFIISVHTIIAKELDFPSDFRIAYSKPAQEDYTYLTPNLISSTLERLCTSTREALNTEVEFLPRVKIVASFFTYFLHIHPFQNGNGRVARILISVLLVADTIVPIPLSTQSCREVFLIV